MLLTGPEIKQAYERTDQAITEINNYLEDVCLGAFKNIYLVSNPALGRNPGLSKLLHNHLFSKSPRIEKSLLVWALNLLRYFIGCGKEITKILMVLFLFRLSRRLSKEEKGKLLSASHLVDGFLKVEDVLEEGILNDKYFPGLLQAMANRKISYVMWPTIYYDFFDPLKFYRFLKFVPGLDAHDPAIRVALVVPVEWTVGPHL